MPKTSQQNATADEGTPILVAPDLPYRPRQADSYKPNIGLIGCGGISRWHLRAYRNAEFNVVACCDIDPIRVDQRRAEFYPQAAAYVDHNELLKRGDIEVVDIATHPPVRPPLIIAALQAGKHVLSQKPFVEDLNVGEKLVDLADQQGVRLAVNQNARWAPHWSYLREAVDAGLLGTLAAIHCQVHWNHGWVKGTPFEHVANLILYDFAIHWFDLLTALMGCRPPQRVYASVATSSTQEINEPLLAQVAVQYEGAQATLVFDGDTRCGPWETTYVTGSAGTVCCSGPNSNSQRLFMTTRDGVAKPELVGSWFPDGFQGTMAELISAIAEKREPTNSARQNLASLALCFAAIASAQRGEPIVTGSIRSLAEARE